MRHLHCLPALLLPTFPLAVTAQTGAEFRAEAEPPVALVRGAWHHIVEPADSAADRPASVFAELHPDSVHSGTASAPDATLPLRVTCEGADDLRILVTGPPPEITDSGMGVRADYSEWTIEFGNGTTWRNDPMAVHPGPAGTVMMEPTGVEQEMTQHLLASRWFRIEYVRAARAGRTITAYYTLPPDTDPQLGEVYYACGRSLPPKAASGESGRRVGEVLPF